MFAFSSIPVIAESNIDSVLNNGMSFSEKLSLSLKMILLGMGTVFAVLFIIWLCLTAFRAVMGKTKKKEKTAPAENAFIGAGIPEGIRLRGVMSFPALRTPRNTPGCGGYGMFPPPISRR